MSDDLLQEYHETRSPEVRARLIEMYLPLVRYNASKMLPGLHSSVELQDLVSWGVFGLIDALERYDPEAGAKFSTFATYRIQGSIHDEMRALAWEPRSVRQKLRAVVTAQTELEHSLGASPSDMQVATHVGISLDELTRVRREADVAMVASLSSPGGDDDEADAEGHLGDTVISPEMMSSELADYAELSASVATGIGMLEGQDRTLFEWVYVQGRPFKDVARVLGVTESWVSHLHTRGLVRLQRILSARY